MLCHRSRNRFVSSLIASRALIGATVVHAQPAADTFVLQSRVKSMVEVGDEGTGTNPYSGSYATGTGQWHR